LPLNEIMKYRIEKHKLRGNSENDE